MSNGKIGRSAVSYVEHKHTEDIVFLSVSFREHMLGSVGMQPMNAACHATKMQYDSRGMRLNKGARTGKWRDSKSMSWCAGESRKRADDILKKTKNVKGDRELQRTPMLLRDEASAVETPSTPHTSPGMQLQHLLCEFLC